MALRNQPYLPLYVDDFTSDEKLLECSAATHGVYIRLICLMHKSEPYGKVLLKQKYKQSDKQINNFASQVAKGFPFDVACVLAALTELIEEKVIEIEGDYLIQKRMVKDALISDKRAKSGSKGGSTTQSKDKKFAKAKSEANTGLYMDIVNGIEDNTFEKGTGKTFDDPRKKEMADALMLHFNFNEIKNIDKLRWIYQFLDNVEEKQGLDYFIETFQAYNKWKELSNEIKHNFTGFLGTPAMKFENAGWDSDNWQYKIDNFKPNGTKSATADAKRASRYEVANKLGDMLKENSGE